MYGLEFKWPKIFSAFPIPVKEEIEHWLCSRCKAWNARNGARGGQLLTRAHECEAIPAFSSTCHDEWAPLGSYRTVHGAIDGGCCDSGHKCGIRKRGVDER